MSCCCFALLHFHLVFYFVWHIRWCLHHLIVYGNGTFCQNVMSPSIGSGSVCRFWWACHWSISCNYAVNTIIGFLWKIHSWTIDKCVNTKAHLLFLFTFICVKEMYLYQTLMLFYWSSPVSEWSCWCLLLFYNKSETNIEFNALKLYKNWTIFGCTVILVLLIIELKKSLTINQLFYCTFVCIIRVAALSSVFLNWCFLSLSLYVISTVSTIFYPFKIL